ncbi:hypothetical protein [Novosphingobium sp. FKTRR1]|uniref:hypothetical protein n=1 Tax=Novosphingobium sp. FKTRR1 TaxID=2879118 RepID=UPI001CF049DF|nr:hypothetical protein [Novosphingobium sp. FKTRR1]
MSAPLLSDLRSPPVVGRFYMVPVIRDFYWHGIKHDWPVLGPMHTDVDHFNFPYPHYHVDIRFLTKALMRRVASKWGYASVADDLVARAASVATCYPLMKVMFPLPAHAPLPLGRPPLARKFCSTSVVPFTLQDRKPFPALRAAYPDPAPAIRRMDGRLLCPHRKVDLSTFAPDAAGVVTCPVHGLRVQCGIAVA